jgi:PhnB protein
VRYLGLCRYPIPTRQFNRISSSPGRCEEALDFYRNAVGAEVQMLKRFKESPEPHGLPDCFDNKIMHAIIRIGKTTLMASDGQCEGNQDSKALPS